MSARHRQIAWAVGVTVVWAGFVAAFVQAARLRASLRELVVIGVLGGAVAVGSLVMMARWWPRVTEGRRPAMVGGRVIGQGWTSPAQGQPPTSARWDQPERDMLDELRRAEAHGRAQNPTMPLPRVTEGRAVVVADPESEVDVQPIEQHLAGYAAGAYPEAESAPRPEVDHLRGFAEGAVDHGRREDDAEA